MKQKGKCKERTLAGTDVKIREQQQHPQFEMGFEGGHAKKYGFKGGTRQKNVGSQGGSPKKFFQVLQ